jgi:two-component system, OmpR family, response regulator
MPRILFVEDDEDIKLSYSGLLKRAGFEVMAVSDKASALEHYARFKPDLVILDIVLGTDSDAGFEICTELRKHSETLPIIFLTALDSDIDKISGLRLGADDYITKDINIEYLLVRIKALLRRVEALSKHKEVASNELKLGDLQINLDTLTASWRNRPLVLNITQVWMLYGLTKDPNRVCGIQQLMDAANITIQPNTVAVHMMNIRKAFIAIDPGFDAIKNERGIGYRWMAKKI